MPDPPVRPPGKRVDELTTELTFEINEKFQGEAIRNRRNTLMINHAIKELAYFKALCEEYEKIIDEG